MNETLDRKLIEKFPKIFKNRYGDLRETAMCWGFECDDGWYCLIEQLCAALQWDTDHNNQPQIVATQVKEKFGTLCFYTQGATDKQFGMIKMIEYLSATVCELCGNSFARTEKSRSGWLKTLCVRCAL